MRKYEEYKHSGINWLGEVPSHWQIARAKDISNISRGAILRPVDEPSYFDTNGEWYYLNISDVKKGEKLLSKAKLKLSKLGSTKSARVSPGNLIITASATIGIPFINTVPVCVHDGFIPFKKNKIDVNFMFYYLSNSDIYTALGKNNTQKNIYLDEAKNITFTFPKEKDVQQAIANYLDVKTQAIDKKVSLLEQKIETYKKLKNTIITKAVTQGISNQEQSINDLGFKTPANWTKYRLKDLGKLFSGLSGKSGDDFNQEDNPNNRGFIPFTNIANNTYLKKDHLGTVVINPGEKQNKVRKGDLFFLMSSEGYGDIGKTAVLADDIEEAYLNSFCKGYRVNQNKCNPYFLNYLLLSNIYRQRLIVEGKGFTRINLKMEKVTDFEIFLPPTLSEQEEIATYIDHKTTTIDAIVGNISKQIETLKQLRKTLINDVVTGKIKVIE